jgi:hypothetical protein
MTCVISNYEIQMLVYVCVIGKHRYNQLSSMLCECRRWLKKEVFGISILCMKVHGV